MFTVHNFGSERLFGAEKVCIEDMRELVKRGHRVGLFFAASSLETDAVNIPEGLEGINLFPVRFIDTKAQVLLSVWDPSVRYQFARAVEQFRPDAIVFHHLVRLSLDLPAVGRREHIPMVYILHDLYPVCPSYSLLRPDGTMCSGGNIMKCCRCLLGAKFALGKDAGIFPALGGVPFMTVRKPLIRRLSHQIDLFVSPSRFLIQELERQGFHPTGKTCVIPNGSDGTEKIDPIPDSGPVRFGYLGNIASKKGVHVLAKAFASMPGKSLVIRGFPDQAAMDAFRADYPTLQARLELFDSDISSFFSGIDVLVVPSICYENQPVVIRESFSFGRPVICSDIGGISEMVEQGGGLTFEAQNFLSLREKVELLSDNREMVKDLARSIPRQLTVGERIDRLLEEIAALPLGNRGD